MTDAPATAPWSRYETPGTITVYGSADNFTVGRVVREDHGPYRLVSGAERVLDASNHIYELARRKYDLMSDDYANARRASDAMITMYDAMMRAHCLNIREV